MAVSPQRENFTNGLVFVSFMDPKFPNDPNPRLWRYQPTGLENTTSVEGAMSGLVWLNQTGVNRTTDLIRSWNWKNIASSRPQLLYQEFTVGIILNKDAVWPELFNKVENSQTNWYVYMASNRDTTPTDPHNLPPMYNPAIMRIRDWTRYNYCFVPGIYRWSLLTIPTYVIELVIYALLVPICLLLSFWWQPMKSRGFTPALAAFSQFTVLIAQMPYLAMPVQGLSQYDCLFQIYFYYAATQISLILIPVHLIRYIFIINLNNAKSIFYTEIRTTREGERKKVDVARWQFRLIKVLTNPWLNFSIVVLWYVFSASVQTIVYLATGFSCGASAYILAILQTVVIIIFIVSWLFGLVYDFIASLVDAGRSIKKSKDKDPESNGFLVFLKFLWNQFAKKDPFYYRFELYFIGPIIITFYLCIALATLIAQIDAQRVVSIAVSSTLFHLLLFYQILFPLGLTLIEMIRQFIATITGGKKQINEEIDEVLLQEEGHSIFVEFAQSEWSTENVSCYDDIGRFRKEKDAQKRFAMAEEMFLMYFNGSKSQLECNVSKGVCDDIKAAIQGIKDGDATELSPVMFNQAEGMIKVNLCDTYSRLRLTQQFKSYSSKITFTKEALGK